MGNPSRDLEVIAELSGIRINHSPRAQHRVGAGTQRLISSPGALMWSLADTRPLRVFEGLRHIGSARGLGIEALGPLCSPPSRQLTVAGDAPDRHGDPFRKNGSAAARTSFMIAPLPSKFATGADAPASGRRCSKA